VKTLNRPYEALREYGINPLTGEACAFGQRILCDLTERGRKIVCQMMGIGYTKVPPPGTFQDNYNSGSRYSCMIPRSILQQELAIWCMIDEGFTDLIVSSRDGIVGREQETYEEWLEYMKTFSGPYGSPYRRIVCNSGPRVADRMVHEMSGRAY
jgi:hypothetical protein